MPLTIGDEAPDFSLPSDGGKDVSLSDYKGENVVLFFYPKDNTPGCTKEAIAFTQLEKDFEAAGAVVIGASKDSIKKHENFRNKHDLTVQLVSDEGGDLCERYGVWQEKKMYGKSFMGIVRSTFLIDRDGKIARIWPKVKVAGHAEEVLEAARELS